MYCLECHDTYPDTARFCSTCGERLCAGPIVARDGPPAEDVRTLDDAHAAPTLSALVDAVEADSTDPPWLSAVEEEGLVAAPPEIAFLEAQPVAWSQCFQSLMDTSLATSAPQPDEAPDPPAPAVLLADAARDSQPEDEPQASQPEWSPLSEPETEIEPGDTLNAEASSQWPAGGERDFDAPTTELESWWVPTAPEWNPSLGTPLVAMQARSTSNVALSIASASPQPAVLESWWVPRTNLALAIDEPVAAPPVLTIVANDVPAPQANIVWERDLAPEHVPDNGTADEGQTALSLVEQGPPPLADPGHLNSSWLGPEVDPPDPASLPQPWWVPKDELVASTESEEPDPVEAASLWTTAQPEIQPGPASVPPEPVVAISSPTESEPTATAPAPPKIDSPPASRARVIYPKSGHPLQTRGKQPTTKQSVRPTFLLAAVIAIILGGMYIWLVAAFSTPAVGRLPPPVPATPLAQDVQMAPSVLPLTVSLTPEVATDGPATARPSGARPSEPVRQAARRASRPTTRAANSAMQPVARPVVPEPVAEPVVQQLPAAALPSQPATPVQNVQASSPRLEPITGQVFDASSVDVRPAVASQVDPQYPDTVAQQRDDVVVLRVLVSPNGRTADTQVLRKSKVDPALDAAAVRAVQQWTFSPAMKRDRSVACWINVGVPFRASPSVASR